MLTGNETVTILLSEYERLKKFEQLFNDSVKPTAIKNIGGYDIVILNETDLVKFIFEEYESAKADYNTWFNRAKKAGWSAEKHGVSPH